MIQLPRSKRNALDWELHVVLDEVDDRDGDACTRAVMVRFGVSPNERRDVYDAVRKAFGDHPQRVTMDAVLDALTRSVPIAHLVGDLWRCEGKERKLAAWLVDTLEREGAIEFR